MNKVNYTKQKSGFCLELDRVRLLLKKIGNPDKELNIIHIAGTNGKGSVGSFIESGLMAMGMCCGRFQSPHLFDVEDGITVDNTAITKSSLKYYIGKLMKYINEVEAELGIAPSPFEILFAASLLYFKRSKCKVVIIECGLGGIGDATNSIEASKIVVFTTIDIDHTDYLGSSVEEITLNKCGILREGNRVYSACQSNAAENVIIDKCRDYKCLLSFAKPFEISGMDFVNAVIDVEFGDTRLALAGMHQCVNAALAAKVLREEYKIGDDELKYALTHATNRARFEEVTERVYFDGAHNVSGVKSLVDTINAAGIEGRMIFAVGFMKDKDISACFDCLKELKNKNFAIYTTAVHSNPRSASADEIRDAAIGKGFEAASFDSISQAVKTAKCNSDVVFAFGSLYMYKELVHKNGRLI